MENLKRRLSFRKKKKDVKVPECSKPHQWQEDEKKVREGSCSFQVRVSRFLHYWLVSRLETINIGKTGNQNHPDLEVRVVLVTCIFNIDFW